MEFERFEEACTPAVVHFGILISSRIRSGDAAASSASSRLELGGLYSSRECCPRQNAVYSHPTLPSGFNVHGFWKPSARGGAMGDARVSIFVDAYNHIMFLRIGSMRSCGQPASDSSVARRLPPGPRTQRDARRKGTPPPTRGPNLLEQLGFPERLADEIVGDLHRPGSCRPSPALAVTAIILSPRAGHGGCGGSPHGRPSPACGNPSGSRWGRHPQTPGRLPLG